MDSFEVTVAFPITSESPEDPQIPVNYETTALVAGRGGQCCVIAWCGEWSSWWVAQVSTSSVVLTFTSDLDCELLSNSHGWFWMSSCLRIALHGTLPNVSFYGATPQFLDKVIDDHAFMNSALGCLYDFYLGYLYDEMIIFGQTFGNDLYFLNFRTWPARFSSWLVESHTHSLIHIILHLALAYCFVWYEYKLGFTMKFSCVPQRSTSDADVVIDCQCDLVFSLASIVPGGPWKEFLGS